MAAESGETYAPGHEYNRPWIEGPYMTSLTEIYLQYAGTGLSTKYRGWRYFRINPGPYLLPEQPFGENQRLL
jgi:hypothetical protein